MLRIVYYSLRDLSHMSHEFESHLPYYGDSLSVRLSLGWMALSISGGVQQGLEVVPRPELAQVTVGASTIYLVVASCKRPS